MPFLAFSGLIITVGVLIYDDIKIHSWRSPQTFQIITFVCVLIFNDIIVKLTFGGGLELLRLLLLLPLPRLEEPAEHFDHIYHIFRYMT